jgi:predicted HAD superfamily Cof-like phosphohydrolase
MHTKYGVHESVKGMDSDKLAKYLQFRVDFLQEELDELKANTKNPEEIVDALIDLCVVAIGTLDAFNVDAYKAWDEVHRANMQKEVGVKATRPNPLKMPDLIKPSNWTPPDHTGNHGMFSLIVDK